MIANCPNCESTYEVADTFEGKSLKCANCNTLFRARLNRAAIKEHSLTPKVEGHWPAKAPRMDGFEKQIKPKSNLPYILAALAGVLIFIAVICSMVYVYQANSPENQEYLRNDNEIELVE